MEHLILRLRKALVHYEECIDESDCEHVAVESLLELHQTCIDVAQKAALMINDICN